MGKSKAFKKALEDALKKKGVKNEWMESHLLIDSLDLNEKKRGKSEQGKNRVQK
tara:strand:+ start:336 stop:497 length:162 start_codon:yes stop_codon:yes gene_type:complete